MKNFTYLSLFVLILQLIIHPINSLDANHQKLHKRWTQDAGHWPSLVHNIMKSNEDFHRQLWNQHKTFMRPLMHMSESIAPDDHDIAPDDHQKESTEFDPSVVIVDKGDTKPVITGTGHHEDPVEVFNPFQINRFNQFPVRPHFWSFGDLFGTGMSAAPKPWWQGQNICTEKKVIEGSKGTTPETTNAVKPNRTSGVEREDDPTIQSSHSPLISIGHSFQHFITFQSTHCEESDTSYTCTSTVIKNNDNKTTITKYHCCHGFTKDANSGQCTKVNLKDLVQTMNDLQTKRMLNLMEKYGFGDQLATDNLTVFAATDESLIDYEGDRNKIENEVEPALPEPEVFQYQSSVRRRRELEANSMKDMLAMHLIPGVVTTGDLEDDSLVRTLSPSKPTIRVNVYHANGKRVVTANCAPVVAANNYAINGVVHIIDRVMPSPKLTVADIIENDSRFTILSRILMVTDLIGKLRDPSQHLTLLAPTDAAFNRLGNSYVERLMRGQSCGDALINNHIIKSTVCSAAIPEYGAVRTALGIRLPVKRVNNRLEVDGVSVLESDKLGTNGVIHVMDEVLISEQSQPMSKYLERHRMTEILDLLKPSGLVNEWDQLTNVSFVIPSTNSLRNLSPKQMDDIRSNTRDMFGYHVVRHESKSQNWQNNEMLDTITGQKMRANVYEEMSSFGFSRPVATTVQCAQVIVANQQICGANVHIIDRFIKPSVGKISRALASVPTLSVLKQIVDSSGIESNLTDGTYTLLAPNDQTLYDQFSEQAINRLIHNASEALAFIRQHLLPEVVCCSAINSSPLLFSSQQFQSLDGVLISAHKTFNGRVRFDSSRVIQCDLMADNAVIHIINRVLTGRPSILPNNPFPNPFELIF